MVELNMELSGSDSYAARFGESIANLGDIDNDGFEGKYIKKTLLGLVLSEQWTVMINRRIMEAEKSFSW